MTLDLYADPIELTKALVDIPSPSHHEEAIADAVEEALRGLDVEVARYGNTVCARTNRGLDSRVVLAGHIDTVPLAENVPHHMETTKDGAMSSMSMVTSSSSPMMDFMYSSASSLVRSGAKRKFTNIQASSGSVFVATPDSR